MAFSNLDFSFPVWLKLFAVFAWPALYFVALPLSIFFDKKQVSAGEVRRGATRLPTGRASGPI